MKTASKNQTMTEEQKFFRHLEHGVIGWFLIISIVIGAIAAYVYISDKRYVQNEIASGHAETVTIVARHKGGFLDSDFDVELENGYTESFTVSDKIYNNHTAGDRILVVRLKGTYVYVGEAT